MGIRVTADQLVPLAEVLITRSLEAQPGSKWQMYGYGLWFAVAGSSKVLFAEKEGINAGVSAVIRHYPITISMGSC